MRNLLREIRVEPSVVEEHIEDMLRKGVIEPSISQWSSCIVLVKRKSPMDSSTVEFILTTGY
jgi:hypothetical protein